MKQLTVLSNPRMAQAFVDYMAVRKIHCKLGAAVQGVGIWLIDEGYLDEAQAELATFLNNPKDQKYQAASWQVAETRTSKFNYGSSKDLIFKHFLSHAGPVTLIILVVAAIVYLVGEIGLQRQLFEYLRFPDQLDGTMTQPWRLITPIFLHFSLLHILFNALWWWQFGGEIEARLGSGKLLLVALVAAIIPNVAQYFASGPYFGGLSGVVYALLGYLWWSGWLRPELGLSVNQGIVGLMLVWLVLGFFDVLGPPTANLAHLFGLLVGCTQAWIDKRLSKLNQ